MRVKDYYKILELPPHATLSEIKKKYRQLALRYHPDTNQDNRYAAAWFREVQEAYNTLSHPSRKEAYLQDRWLQQSKGVALDAGRAFTPDAIVTEAKQLAAHASALDHFRMDHQGMAANLMEVLHAEKLDMLHAFGDHRANREVVMHLLKASEPVSFAFLDNFFNRLKQLAIHQPELLAEIETAASGRRRLHWWANHQWWIILLATLLLCLLVFTGGRSEPVHIWEQLP